MPIPANNLTKNLKRITIDGKELYLDGDVLLEKEQLDAYAGTMTMPEGGSADELLAATEAGRVVRWRPSMTLRYAVLKKTFPSVTSYGNVVAMIEAAASGWENTCGVKFEHVTALDASDDPSAQVVFIVRHLDVGGEFLAAAFFPSDKGMRRQVIIDPSFYGTHGFDATGILRHELGHVLGFRHEHIRNAAAAALLGVESTADTYDLTQYDTKSVMHYVGGSFGNSRLEITDLDRLGAQRVYGLPLKYVTLTE